jgi:hypothetical protein
LECNQALESLHFIHLLTKGWWASSHLFFGVGMQWAGWKGVGGFSCDESKRKKKVVMKAKKYEKNAKWI